MGTFKKYDIGEEVSVQINLSDYLSPAHLCKEIEKITSELDISFIESTYSSLGQKAYHPMMLLSIIFYGYTIGIRSGRRLSTACKENLAFIYLSKGHQPCKSVINDFRKANYQHFSNLFNQVLKKCMSAGLGNPELSIVDGSKMRANSAKKNTKTKEQYEKWQKHLSADIASLEQAVSNAEQEELKKKLTTKKALSEKIETATRQLSTAKKDATLNLTDTDSLIMKGKKGNFDTNYNVQAACSEDQIVTYCEVVLSGNDKAQLVPALKGITQNTGKAVKIALADADYGTFDSIEYMSRNDIEGYVPYQDMNTTHEKKPYHTANFLYDKSSDSYTCPNQQTLEFYRTSERKDRGHHYKNYRTDACKQCPFQKECCPKKLARRVITREIRQDFKDEMKQRLNSTEGQQIYKKRLHPIEALFGQLKYNLGYTQFLLRGLEKVTAEFTLMCITHNLRKMIVILSYFLRTGHNMSLFLTQKMKKIVFPDLSMNFYQTL